MGGGGNFLEIDRRGGGVAGGIILESAGFSGGCDVEIYRRRPAGKCVREVLAPILISWL